MSVFKCRGCGNMFEIKPGEMFGVCSGCGTKQFFSDYGYEHEGTPQVRAVKKKQKVKTIILVEVMVVILLLSVLGISSINWDTNNNSSDDTDNNSYISYEDSTANEEEKKSESDWKVDIIANNSESDNRTDLQYISKNKNIYFHVSLSGGAPGDTVKLNYVGYFPNGEKVTGKWNERWSDGWYGNCYFYYENPEFGKMGEFTFEIYDDEGNKLGEKTVDLINS